MVFVDTETTGVDPRFRRAWDIALIRRENNGYERSITIFVKLEDLDLERADPEGLSIGGFYSRHPQHGGSLAHGQYLLDENAAARLVQDWTAGSALYAVNVAFDADVLLTMMARQRLQPRWTDTRDIRKYARRHITSSGNSAAGTEDLSVQCGVALPAPHVRHTGMGDADWVKRWFDQMCTLGVEMTA